jgi:hypothetical protein
MTQQRAVHILAGCMVLVSIILAVTVSKWFLLLTGFVGLNLTQSGFTGFCPAEKIFARMGLKEGSCDPRRA